MNSKQKAKELIEKFENANSGKMSDYSKIYTPTAKKCALICVDEIMLSYIKPLKDGQIDRDNLFFIDKYWQEVKQEIKNL